jgi:alkylation response protein AidB-like acyl-CoA dehydrogenase
MEPISQGVTISGSGKDDLYLTGNGGFLLCPTPTGKIFTREQLNAEQLEMGKMVKNFIESKVLTKKKEIEYKQVEIDGMPLCVKLLKELGNLGALGVDVPETYGGLGMDLTTTMHVAENLGPAGGSFTTTAIVQMGIGALPILFFGTPEQKAQYLPKLVSAEWVACYALTEAGSGSDALSGKTTAVLDGDFYTLNGNKQFISNGDWADLAIVFARIDDQYSALIVELNSPGVSRGLEEEKMGIQGSSTTALMFDNVKVPRKNLLGKAGDAATIALNILNMGRLELGFACIGATRKVIQHTLEYTKQRKQFGRPICEFDMQTGRLAEMVTRLFAVDSILYRIIHAIDDKIAMLPKDDQYWDNMVKVIRSHAMEASVAKVEGSEMVFQISSDAVKMHGGYGYISDYHVEQALRDSVINMIYEGTNDINRLVIFDFLVRSIYNQNIPFAAFSEEVDASWRKGIFSFPDNSPILHEERKSLYAGKYLLNFLVNETIMRFGKDIKNNQQVMRHISDMILPLYAADSAIARAYTLIEKEHSEAKIAKAMAELCLAQALATTQTLAWQLMAEIYEGKPKAAGYGKLTWLCSFMKSNHNPMRLKREIGRTVVEKGLKILSL